MPKKKQPPINNIVVVSDTHCGCRLGLCPPEPQPLDDGGSYTASKLQKKVWSMWEEFWGEWVPDATRGEPFAVVHNGDCVDGVHHNSTTQISHNLEDQSEIAYRILRPVVDACEGRYYHIRGTEAHVAKSGREEERLAKLLGAIPNSEGQHARYDLWKWIGPNKDRLIHFLHHVGTTSSQAYEATAVHKELVESFAEAARWGERPPDCVGRSHRHRFMKTEIPTARGSSICFVTPGWQGKTPFCWKIAGARLTTPQFGGCLIRFAHNRLFIDQKVWTIDRSPPE